MEDRYARKGELYVCTACGKTAIDPYGEGAQYGWDESCFLNSHLFDVGDLIFDENGRVKKITGKPLNEDD